MCFLVFPRCHERRLGGGRAMVLVAAAPSQRRRVSHDVPRDCLAVRAVVCVFHQTQIQFRHFSIRQHITFGRIFQDLKVKVEIEVES